MKIDMKSKKPIKNNPLPEGTPQEILASFTGTKEKEFIKEAEKMIIYDLYEAAIRIPSGLRNEINQTSIVLSPAPVIGEPEHKMFRSWLDIRLALLGLMKFSGVIKEYKLKNRYDKSTDELDPPNDMVFSDIKYYPSDVISYYEDYKKTKEPIAYKIAKEEPIFDGLNRAIIFGHLIYTFQKSEEGKQRLLFFKELWDERMTIKNRLPKKQGQRLPAETVATKIGMVDSPHTYLQKFNAPMRQKFNLFIKNLNTNLRRKKLPVKIAKIGGIQIVVRI